MIDLERIKFNYQGLTKKGPFFNLLMKLFEAGYVHEEKMMKFYPKRGIGSFVVQKIILTKEDYSCEENDLEMHLGPALLFCITTLNQEPKIFTMPLTDDPFDVDKVFVNNLNEIIIKKQSQNFGDLKVGNREIRDYIELPYHLRWNL